MLKNEKKSKNNANKNNKETDDDPKNEVNPNEMPNIKKKKTKNTNQIEKSNKKSQKTNVEDTNKTNINESNSAIKNLEISDNEQTKMNELPVQNSKLDTPSKNDNKTNLKKRKNNKKEKLEHNEGAIIHDQLTDGKNEQNIKDEKKKKKKTKLNDKTEINQCEKNEQNNNDHNLQPGNMQIINEEKDTLFIDIKEREEAKENYVDNSCATAKKAKTNNRNNNKNKNTKEKNVKLVTQNAEITNLIKQDQTKDASFINNDDNNKGSDPATLVENEKDSKHPKNMNSTKLKKTNEKSGAKEKNDIDHSKNRKKKETHKINDKTEQDNVKSMVLDSISKQNSPTKNEASKEIVEDNNNLKMTTSSCSNDSLNAQTKLSQNITENKFVEPEKGKSKKKEKTKQNENDKIKQNEPKEDTKIEIQDNQPNVEETKNNEEMKIYPKDQEKVNEKEKKKDKDVTEIKKINKKEELNKGKPIKIVLSDTDAKEKIYKYMRQTNRPYSVINVYDNLHGMISKNSVQKIMDELSIEKKLQCKEYGKAKIYLINQKEFESLNVEEINKLKNSIEVVKGEVELAKNYYNDLLKKKKKLIEDLDLIKNVNEYKKTLLQIEDEIHIYEEANKNCKISIDEIDTIKNNHGYLHSVWFKRKKLCIEIIKCIASVTEKDTQGVIYHLGIDTDEDVIPLNLYF
ncbi:Tat binding protein 1(TBP-1)-interacting protein, putative [Plasmodium vinckei lentum]|uniref:Tat binding protein 1(TBP-1)-interacting protein, putative n=1 Tax=Plasmodium vinckei lentum TaxID=138297 RepID=A0A6V7RZT2_PLAVN|nr:Tat binding protein 1(TBP-1)-interacting protein, putative [Plasmodium vinckei lentum]